MEKITKIEEVFDYGVGVQPYDTFEGFIITTDKRQIKFLVSDQPSCCETFGHLSSLDDTAQFISAELKSVGVVDTALKTTELKLDGRQIATEECVFVNLETSAGLLQLPEPSPQPPSELAVQLLKEAKKLLPWKGSLEDGICYALARVTGSSREEFTACANVQQAIAKALMPYSFYSTWVNTKLGAFQDSDAIQEARHRWVDQLIVDFGGTP